jgi:hypothetical protein
MALDPSGASPGGAASHRLVNQAPERLAPHPPAGGLGRHRFRLHDNEEIGPRMLARIAKRSGLSPQDL